jgi:hypothetical protein
MSDVVKKLTDNIDSNVIIEIIADTKKTAGRDLMSITLQERDDGIAIRSTFEDSTGIPAPFLVKTKKGFMVSSRMSRLNAPIPLPQPLSRSDNLSFRVQTILSGQEEVFRFGSGDR